jgi:hypothetical protein
MRAERQRLVAERAAVAERLAKQEAEARREEAETQERRALAGEKLASERLVQVEAEKKKPDAWTSFNAARMLGSALLGQKKYADAEPLLLIGDEGMKEREKSMSKSGGAEKRIPEALDALIELYTATNKPDEVKKWQAERAKYPEGKPAQKNGTQRGTISPGGDPCQCTTGLAWMPGSTTISTTSGSRKSNAP